MGTIFSDRRRSRRHRCWRCQISHLKCDGLQPCSFCSSRGFECAGAQDPVFSLEFVPFSSRQRRQQPIRAALSLPSWRYTSICLDAIESPTSTWPFQLLSHVVSILHQQSELVSTTLAIVGGMYVSANNHVMYISAREKKSILAAMKARNKLIQGQMAAMITANQGRRHSDYRPVLSCALLLCAAELYVTKTGRSMRDWLQQTWRFIEHHAGQRPEDSENADFDEKLNAFYRLVDLQSAIAFTQLPVSVKAPPISMGPSPGNLLLATSIQENTPAVLIDILEAWSVLEYRASSWVSDVRALMGPFNGSEGYRTLPVPDLSLEAEGLEIICAATTLQRHVISILGIIREQETTSRTDFFPAYLHWALTGLSQIFASPEWQYVDCPLPSMDKELVWREARHVMEYTEQCLDQTNIGVAWFIVMIDSVGYEMKAEEDRKRVLQILKCIRSRGFGLVDSVEKEMVTFWAKDDWQALQAQASALVSS